MFHPRSPPSELDPNQKHAVVISVARAHSDGHTSLVYCSKIDEERGVVSGNPFRLYNEDGWYIWPNDIEELRDSGIEAGSILTYRYNWLSKTRRYLCNTRMKLESSYVLSLLNFREHGGVVYRGIEEAFPNAVIAETKGIYQETRPNPSCALISIAGAFAQDGRVGFLTQLDEVVDLKNNSIHELFTLPVQAPSSEDYVRDVVLVVFGSNPTEFGRYQAVCEGVFLHNPAESTDEVHTRAAIPENQELPSYAMKRSPRGKCLILSNETFHDESHNRDGAKVDEKALKELFQELGFIVNIRKDLTSDKIYKVVRHVAAEDHSNYDAFVLIIMSHGGDRDAVSGVDGRPVYVEDIMREFRAMNCPTLRNKAKLFFVQCCRGASSEFLSPADRHCDPVPRLHHDSTLARSACPQEADFLLAFGAAPGYYSYRYPTGSVFIQVLVDVIKKHHQHSHLVEMLAEVARLVVERGMAANEKIPRVQVPAYSSTLRAKLYL